MLFFDKKKLNPGGEYDIMSADIAWSNMTAAPAFKMQLQESAEVPYQKSVVKCR